jgi:hypothetical protein
MVTLKSPKRTAAIYNATLKLCFDSLHSFIQYEDAWAPDPVWILSKREERLVSARD